MTRPPEMACKTCLSPLNTLGNPPTYVHPVHLATDGHDPLPVPVNQLDTVDRRCDFCGDEYPTWTLTGGEVAAIAIGETAGLVQDFGDNWAACVTCHTYLDDRRPDKVVDRAVRALGLGDHQQARKHIERLHSTFLAARRPERTLITTTAWPAATITARELPKVRDRLAGFYRGPDNLPTALGIHDVREHLAVGLDRSRLYWIDGDFTDLAAHAAGTLPEVTISRDLTPSDDGLLVWSRPVATGGIAATSWTRTDDGWHLVNYRTIGGGLDDKPLQRIREQVGWLAPLNATPIREEQLLPGSQHPAAPLVATWLLIAQQAAEMAAADIDKGIRKHYARTNRPAPDVRIVRIRTSHTTPSSRPAQGSPERLVTSRVWVSGHWRNQPYGPGRSLRRPVYINPFLRGPDDAPIKLSTTVRMLSSRKPKPHDTE